MEVCGVKKGIRSSKEHTMRVCLGFVVKRPVQVLVIDKIERKPLEN